MPKNFFSILELFLASVLWAFSFVGTIWCLESFSPAWTVALRFLISFVVSLVLFHLIPRKGIHFSALKIALVPSLLLAALMLFTAWGQRYTTATNASFITCLYVLYVPLFEKFVSKKSIAKTYWIFIFAALIGAGLICKIQEFKLNAGDLLVLIGSVFAGAQIFWFGLIANKLESGFEFNTSQSLISMTLPLIFALSFDRFPTHVSPRAFWGLVAISIGSTLIGFALQVRGQKKISATAASIIYQVESPLAAIFAYFLLNERMSLLQVLGAILIFSSALGASFFSGNKFHQVEVRMN